MKAYLVVPTNYEYNDEIYYEQGSGTPQEGYRSREKALLKATEKNMKEFRGLDLSGYCYDWNEIINDIEGFNRIAAKAGIPAIDPGERWQAVQIPANISNELLLELIDVIDLKFYHVVDVEIDGD